MGRALPRSVSRPVQARGLASVDPSGDTASSGPDTRLFKLRSALDSLGTYLPYKPGLATVFQKADILTSGRLKYVEQPP